MSILLIILRNLSFVILLLASFVGKSQLPNPAIVGYWENWNGSRFVQLKDVDSRYNVINIAFASKKLLSDYDLRFKPPGSYSEQEFKSQIEQLQSEGKKIIISIGGQNDAVILDSLYEKEQFVTSVNEMIDYWGFDGLDIDLEGHSLNFNNINIQNPSKILIC